MFHQNKIIRVTRTLEYELTSEASETNNNVLIKMIETNQFPSFMIKKFKSPNPKVEVMNKTISDAFIDIINGVLESL